MGTGLLSGLNPRRMLLPVLTCAYVGMLHVSYAHYVAPTFGYLGMEYRSPTPWIYVALTVLLCASAALMPQRLRSPADLILWVHFIVATVPSVVVPQWSPVLDEDLAFRFGLMVVGCWVLVLLSFGFLSERVARARPPRAIASARGLTTTRRWVGVLLGLSILADVLLLSLPGVRPNIVGFAVVTDVRLAYREALTHVPFAVPYLLLAATNVVNPALLAYGLLRAKRWPLVLVAVTGQLLNYAVTGYKTVVLSLVVVAFLTLWSKRRPFAGWGLLAATVAGMMAALALFAATGFTSAATYFTTRVLAVPGNVASATVAYFADRPPLHWSYSFMSWLLDYPYDKDPAFLVGYSLSRDENTSANVNSFGDGYMNLGYAGIALECALLVAILVLVDCAARGVRPELALPILVVPAFALSNSNVFTAVLTHGFLLAAVVLALAPRVSVGDRLDSRVSSDESGRDHDPS